jgi:hypothetical protein
MGTLMNNDVDDDNMELVPVHAKNNDVNPAAPYTTFFNNMTPIAKNMNGPPVNRSSRKRNSSNTQINCFFQWFMVQEKKRKRRNEEGERNLSKGEEKGMEGPCTGTESRK